MTPPTFATAPTAEQVDALTCPVDRARVLTRLARRCGTLPKALADRRVKAIVEARLGGTEVAYLVAVTGMSAQRIYNLSSGLVRVAQTEGGGLS